MQIFGIFASIFALILICVSAVCAFVEDGFVQVKGDQFVLSSDPSYTFKAKGFNYSPMYHPWRTWSEWDPDAIRKELSIAADLGCNTLRVAIPFNDDPGPEKIRLFNEFLSIAAENGMKVMFILFDHHGSEAVPGSQDEAANFRMIDAICGALRDSKAIFAWDIKNEPDMACGGGLWSWHLPGAEDCAKRRLSWLQRMRDRIKKADPNHLITVGLVFNYNNYLPEWSAITVESMVDFVCYHYYTRNYPSQTFRDSIRSLKTRTTKPINIQEIGHTTDGTPNYSEMDQASNFRYWLKVIDEENITGLVQWALCEWHKDWPGSDEERYYGFLRNDGKYSLKPAAHIFRDKFPVEQFYFSQKTGTISGTIKNNAGEPVEDALVMAIPGFRSSRSDKSGRYEITGVHEGAKKLRIVAKWHEAAEIDDVKASSGVTTDASVVLKQAPPPRELINSGFEVGDLTGWTPWNQFGGVQSGPCQHEIKAREGSRFFVNASTRGPMRGGVHQTVTVIPGETYEAVVWIRTHIEGEGEGRAVCRIGLDPSGTGDEMADGIIWSDYADSESEWISISVKAEAKTIRMTILLDYVHIGSHSVFVNGFDDISFKLIK